MYETDMTRTDRELGLGFDSATRERMRAVFGGQSCCRCGAPAERLSADQFYCGLHFPERRSREERPHRVYRCVGFID